MIDLEPVSDTKLVDAEAVQNKFLEKYIETHSKIEAMQHAGIPSLGVIEQWAKDDQTFRDRFEQAQELLKDNMEAAAYKRAVIGIDKPVYQGKELVGYIREYSDSLLTTMLKGNIPEKYGTNRPNTLESPLGGDNGPLPAPMTLNVVHEVGREFGQMLARRAGRMLDEESEDGEIRSE
jgi:hypothetical protein